MFGNNDFKGYRNLLGFNSQNAFKEFLGAKDIQPCVDFNYLNALKKRLIEIFSAINSIYCFKYNEYELEYFFKNSIERVFSKIVDTHIIYKLNNQGRRPEEVCFSWMQGYRNLLGFNSQNAFKEFLGAKDIQPCVDFNYLNALKKRLIEIFSAINSIYCFKYNEYELEYFFKNSIERVFSKIVDTHIIYKLNNQGRRPEEVCFSWMRGFLVAEFFKDFIACLFGAQKETIKFFGGDNFESIESFKRSPKADFLLDNHLLLEVQSGFQGINDIKEHKVIEAKRRLITDKIPTIVVHFDLFNGQVACVEISKIKDNDLNWITRQQMEGQSVFNISQNFFDYKITEIPNKPLS